MSHVALIDCSVAACAPHQPLFLRTAHSCRRWYHTVGPSPLVLATTTATLLAAGISSVCVTAAQSLAIAEHLNPKAFQRIHVAVESREDLDLVQQLPTINSVLAWFPNNTSVAKDLLGSEHLRYESKIRELVGLACERGHIVDAWLASALSCTFRGDYVHAMATADRTRQLMALGCRRVVWDDTGAMVAPRQLETLIKTSAANGVACGSKVILAFRGSNGYFGTPGSSPFRHVASLQKAIEMNLQHYVTCAGSEVNTMHGFGGGLLLPEDLLKWTSVALQMFMVNKTQTQSSSDVSEEERRLLDLSRRMKEFKSIGINMPRYFFDSSSSLMSSISNLSCLIERWDG